MSNSIAIARIVASRDESQDEPHSEPRADPTYHVEEQVGHLLRRAHQRATHVFMERIGADGLTPTKFAALVKLADLGEVSQNHLGRLTAMDPATSQGVIRRLEAQGLIERRADSGDKRRSMLRLTPAGRALVAATTPNAKAVTAATLEPLDPVERRQFLALLRKLI
jgi:MarR family transcriptional regulator, lower aerobic nicotinate degradation pathway regulator